MTGSNSSIPYGYCHCGCGRKTNIATYNSKRQGVIKGEPLAYLVGHYVRRTKRVTLTCGACETSFQVVQSRAAATRFCSRACWLASRLCPSVSLECETCRVAFQRPLYYHRYLTEKQGITRTFCSLVCKNESERKPIPATAIDDYVSGLTLQEVGSKHNVSAELVRRFLIASGVNIRSRTAHLLTDKNPTRGKGHTEAAKAKIREANRKQFSNPANRALASENQRRAMAEGKISAMSKLEDLVAVELDALGVPYERQYGVRYPLTGRYCACVDFKLDERTVIEVNGTYWHADPRVYSPDDLHVSQRRTLANYVKKMDALKSMGIRVIEIWELDFKQDPAGTVKAALV